VAEDALTVAVAQTISAPGDVTANAKLAAQAVPEAQDAGAQLLIFPELSLVGYDLGLLGDPSVWVTLDDPRLDPLRRPPLTTVVGAPYRAGDGTPLLAALVFHPDGGVPCTANAICTGPNATISGPARPRIRSGSTAGGLRWRSATTPVFRRTLRTRPIAGAEVYAASVLYTREEVRRFDLHFAARAMDHRMYAVAANHAGTGPGWESCGGSGVWHPDGRRLAQAGTEPSILTWTLSRSELSGLRERDARAGYPHSK
jgi:predicted amidohydrolase